MITAIIIASGYSRRLKTDKLMLDFCGKPVLEHTLNAVSEVSFAAKILIQREHRYDSLAAQYHFTNVYNPLAQQGQSASIRLGLACAVPGSATMFFVGDQPNITQSVIQALVTEHYKAADMIIVPESNGRYRNPVIFPAALTEELSQLEGDTGGRQVIRNHPEKVKSVSFEETLPFMDIDTLEDYQFLLHARSKSLPVR